jgi:hypothetical protein
MTYSKVTLTQATGTQASTDEIKGVLDSALNASGKYSKVTAAYTFGTRFYDVWRNDGSTDGYQWYLITMYDTGSQGRIQIGACLEYDDPTKIAKKALRGYSGLGFVDANGYPLDAAGGNELTIGLASFGNAGGYTTGCTGAISGVAPPQAVQGNILRVLVTGRFVWTHWGTATVPAYACGVGTYDRLHPNTTDSRPLAFMVHSCAGTGTTAWQHPAATNATVSRTSYAAILATTTTGFDPATFTALVGQVGSGDGTPDLTWNGVYVGSRMHITRSVGGPTTGGGANMPTAGHSIGLVPDDFLLFFRKASVLTGDTLTVNGKTYEHVSPGGYALPGVFINTAA